MLHNFAEFLKENRSDLFRVMLAVSTNQDNRYLLWANYHVRQYMDIFTKGSESSLVEGVPIINYSNIHTERLLNKGTKEELIYNKVDAKYRVAKKRDWYKLHSDSPYIPLTVYNKNELEALSFPIIAKPDNRYSGLGIVKFETIEDAKSADLSSFTIFSEKKEIVEEHRIVMWRGEAIDWFERKAADDSTKHMDVKKNEKLRFNYILRDIKDMPKDWNECFEPFVKEHSDLDFYSMDLAIDKNGKKWIIEMSSEFGTPFGVMGKLYKRVFEDFYGRPMNPDDSKQIDAFIYKDIQATLAADFERFSKQ